MSLQPQLSRIARRSLALLLLAVGVLLLGACGSTSITSTGPSPVKCQVTLTGPDAPLAPSASVGTITVSTTPECAWTATADASWVARIDPSSGQGSGTLQVTVAANGSSIARQTDVVVNGARARIQQEPTACVYVLSESSATVDATGGTHEVAVATSPGCGWTASTGVPWISIAAGSSVNGSGVVAFTVLANDGSTRSGDVTIAGQSFTFTQNGAGTPSTGGLTPAPGCTYALSPLSQTVPAAGGSGSLSLTTSCAWSVTATATWITIQSPTIGTGNATVVFSVGANNGAARQGTITIGNAIVRIDQAAAANCAFTVNPTTMTAPVGGSAGMSVAVSTTASCGWTATSTAAWITVTAGATGTGNGNVTFRVAANSGGARTGTIDVAGKTVSVTQPASCSFVVNPLTVPVAPTGVTGQSVSVTTTAGCAWTAASGAPWVTITAGASGSGSGTVKFDVGANTGGARNGTLTVAGQAVTVAQASSCTYVVNPATVSMSAAGGSGPAVSVSTAADCAWTATSDTTWLTITAGSSGSGNGTVNFTAAQNTGDARAGSLSIAGQTVSVNQASGCVYTVTLTPTSFRKAGGTATGTVTTAPGCSWTTSSGSSWIVVQSGASGSGPGMATLEIQANPGGSRTGTVTIAGQSFNIQQSNK